MYAPNATDNTNEHIARFRHVFCDIPQVVFTPVSVPTLRQFLTTHPNQRLVHFVLQRFTFGFGIGFCGLGVPSRPRNLLSARNNPVAVCHH